MSGPLPPRDFQTRKLEALTIEAGQILHRIYTAGYDPIYYDRSLTGRLNAPDGAYGVLYVAKKRRGAVAETFLRSPGRLLLDHDLIEKKAYCACRTTKKLVLLKMTGRGLALAGATGEITHGPLPYDIPQRWSKVIYDHRAMFDGIAYTSRHDDEQVCYALFDRVAAGVRQFRRQKNLNSTWFYQILDSYGVGLAP